MNKVHDRDAASSLQEDKRKTRHVVPPRMRLGEVYSIQDLTNNLGVSNSTVALWQRQGLRPIVDGTKSKLFLSDDIISFWKSQRK